MIPSYNSELSTIDRQRGYVLLQRIITDEELFFKAIIAPAKLRSLFTSRVMESKKSNKIRDIVRLQQILKKWRKLASSSSKICSNSSGSGSKKSIKFLKKTLSVSENSARESSNNNIVPKGYLAVCVGGELKRFIIPTEYLGHPAFHMLLREAEEEFGFQQTGVLRIPCEVAIFESILKLVEEKKDLLFLQDYYRFDMDDPAGNCSSKSHQTPSHHSQSPMCR